MVQKNKNKTGLLVGAGTVAAGLILILSNTKARKKLKESSSQMKDSVSNYASTVKEDPAGTKNMIIDKVKRTTEITKDAVNKIQQILDNQGQEIKETTQDMVEQSKDVVSTAKDAQEDLKEVSSDMKDAKNEMKPSSQQKKSKETDHHVLDEPINKF
ncbi:hypothetical protein [Virgibacillus ainsalahensis]